MFSTPHEPDLCHGCNLCLPVCPGWRRHHDIRLTARGFATALRRDQLPTWEALENCSLCGACEPVCPRPIRPVEIILELRRRHMRSRGTGDLYNRFSRAMLEAPVTSGAIEGEALLLPGCHLSETPHLLAGTRDLLGRNAVVAQDCGCDISNAVEAGVAVPEGRRRNFIRSLDRAAEIIVADGLLFRILRGWLPKKTIRSLGEGLSRAPELRANLRPNDLYLIEPRAYHADFGRLREYYRGLRRLSGCRMNLDLQGAAFPTDAGCMEPRGVAQQVEWIIRHHPVDRIVAECPGDAEAVASYNDIPAYYLGEISG